MHTSYRFTIAVAAVTPITVVRRVVDRVRLVAAIAALALLLPGCATATAAGALPATILLHVSPDGRDGATGADRDPAPSVAAALDLMRQRLDAERDRDVRIVVRDGTYRIATPITIRPADLPREGRRLEIVAADGAEPVISGAEPILGWRRGPDGSLVADLPPSRDFRELFVGGQRRPRARHPNTGFARVVAAGPDGRTSLTFSPGELPTALGAGAELVLMHDWSTSRVGVRAVDHRLGRIELDDPVGMRAAHYRIDNFEPHPRYFVEGHTALLDAPGEWHLDRDAGVVRYLPLPGEAPETLDAVAPVAPALLVVRGNDARPVRDVHVRGLTFAHAAWPLPPGGWAGGQATMHERRDDDGRRGRTMMDAAVVFERAESCSLEACRVADVGMTAVWIGARTRDCVVRGCLVDGAAGNGINLGEGSRRRVGDGPWWQTAPDQAAASLRVTDCLVRRCGAVFFGAVGIWVGLAHDVTVAHNEVTELPYTGVSVGWMWNATPTPARDNVVEYNHVHDVMRLLSDGGCVYTLGRQPGSAIRFNDLHGVPANAGRAESNGIFADQGTERLLIADNLIHDVGRSPLRFHQALVNVVRDNLLVVPDSTTPPVRYNSTDPASIVLEGNEIVVAPSFGPADGAALRRIVGPRAPHRARWASGGDG